ncbi:MAG: ABC transporter permease subunit [Candidatus Limiplasma sp.]|nr:ABC transporter permease subunit [Candidatus Limiplasma sp.]MDY4063681.1 ABC transporter permease subunit [Candidatus Limiplasma sp.]
MNELVANTGTQLRRRGERTKTLALTAMLIPGLIVLFFNSYLPMAGIVMAFQKIDYSKFAFAGKWVGLRNLKLFFGSTYTPVIIRNTLLYNFAFIVLGKFFSMAFAVALNELRGLNAKKVYQGVMFLPYFISWVAVSYIALAFLHTDYGLVNRTILPMLGMEGKNWYQTPAAWPGLLIFFNLWKGTGYGTVMFLASIAGIDPSLYEAARIDGANRWQQIIHITLPMLYPMLIITTLLSIGSIFNTDIGLFYSVPMRSINGLLADVTTTLDTYVYVTFSSGGSASTVNLSSAAAFIQSIIGFVLVLLSNMVVKKINPDYVLF